MKKYELTGNFKIAFGKKLFQIKALINIERYDVKAGDFGGFVEKEENLSQEGDAWVSGNARVFGDARVSGNARVFGDAWVSGNAEVFSNAFVSGNARVFGDAWVSGNAEVFSNARVFGNAEVSGNAFVSGDAEVSGNARVFSNARVFGDARVSGNARVFGDAIVFSNAEIYKTTHYLVIGAIGSRNDFTTFFRTKSNEIYVKCGCFNGNIDEFKEKVHAVHEGTKHEKTYLLAVELAKEQIELE